MHTLKLPLKPGIREERFLAQMFRTIANIHNAVVSYGKKRLRMYKRDKRYKKTSEKYVYYKELLEKLSVPDLKEDETDAALIAAYNKALATKAYYEKQLSYFGNQFNQLQEEYGLTKDDVEAYAKTLQHRYSHILTSPQVQKEADHVWDGIYKVLYKGAKQIHYKKWTEFNTISQKSTDCGVRFDRKSMSIEFKNATISVVFKDDRKFHYKAKALDAEVSYYEIKRMKLKSGWRYYVNIVLKGPAPKKLISGNEIVGIDPGVSTEAIDSEKWTDLFELAPDYKRYNEKIKQLQRGIDRKKRLLNPENYNEDGTIKKGRHTWKKSKRLKREEWLLSVMYQKKSLYMRQSHDEQINKLIPFAKGFLVEEMNFKALAKRAKKQADADREKAAANDKSGKYIVITKKDGTTVTVRKNKRTKRFGPSINNRAPGLFLTRLKTKAKQYGLTYETVNSRTMKASQYDHTTGECTKVPLSQRMKEVGGKKVQRDMYSAFLIRNAKADRKTPNRSRCKKGFDAFVTRQNAAIERIIASGVERPACFGF